MLQWVKQFKMIFSTKHVHGRFISLAFDLESFCIDPSVKKKQKCYKWCNELKSDKRG